jgi:major membrane immunogen (membrane-anchored lipoprotein)
MKESLTKFLRTSIYPIAAIAVLLLLVAPAAADMDGVMMHDGKMMMMKAGQPATAMDHEVTMSDGTIVEVDGTVKSKDGKTFHLQDGEMIMMDGHLMKGGKAAPMSP